MQTTYFAKTEQVEKNWIVVDAEGVVLGRLASYISIALRGKNKPTYTPHIDDGDQVIVINAEKVCLTGQKRQKKEYHRHSGHPGGIKTQTAAEVLAGKHPERVIEKAVSRMMPDGRLARKQLKNLYVYCGSRHPHQAQKPKIHDFGSQNEKNILGSEVVSNKKLINDIVEALEPVFKDRLEVALDPVSKKIDKTNLTLGKLAKDFSEFKDQATRSAQSGAETAEHTGKEVDLQNQMLLELRNISSRLDALSKPSKP